MRSLKCVMIAAKQCAPALCGLSNQTRQSIYALALSIGFWMLIPLIAVAQQSGVTEVKRQTSPTHIESETSDISDQAAPIVASSAVVSDARFSKTGQTTTLQLDVSTSVTFNVFLLADPPRAVVDLPAVEFRLPDDVKTAGLVSSWRKGLFSPTQSRIVMDLTEPAIFGSAVLKEAQDGRPAYLAMALKPASTDQFVAAVRDGQIRQTARRSTTGEKSDRLPIRSEIGAKNLIILDPGHGGLDYGTIGSGGTPEKDVVLNFALALGRELEATGDYSVKFTRDTDVFVPLDKRVRFARDKSADLFISLHADSVRQKYVRGASVYTVSQRASDEIAQELADNENRSDVLAGVTFETEEDFVADILVDLTRRETKTFSVRFADVVVDEMRPRIRLVSNPHRYAGFRVLRAPDVPSVLVELGFLSNKDDEELLTSADWQEKAIESMLASIDRFFGNASKRQTQTSE